MGTRDEPGSRGVEEMGADKDVIDARFGDNGTVGEVGVSELLSTGLEHTKSISEGAKGGGEGGQGKGPRGACVGGRGRGQRRKGEMVKGREDTVRVNKEVGVEVAGRNGDRALRRSKSGCLGGATVSMKGDDEGGAPMDSDADSKKAAIRVTGMQSARAKGRGRGEENGNAAVGAEGLVRGAVGRGPEGLAGPISSPLTFFGG